MKKYNYQGSTFVFNTNEFVNAFNFVVNDKGITQAKYLEEISGALHSDPQTIKGWLYSNHSPMDVETVVNLAKYFNKSEYAFLKELKHFDVKEEDDDMTKEVQESIKRIYDAIIEYLFEFNMSDGFNNYWFEFLGEEYIEHKIIEKVNNEIHAKVRLAYDKEYFYLHGLKVYEDLEEYIGETLYDIFDGKVSYAYRFECDGITQNTAYQDYEEALEKLHKILGI